MNIDYYIKKKHLFKRRKSTVYKYCLVNFSKRYEIYTMKNIRFEFVYIRVFKKLLRRRYIKGRIKLFKPRYWLFLLPNFILTQKSKNSRMGAGVGKFVRLVMLKYSFKTIIKTWRYTLSFLNYFIKYLFFKLSLKCYIR